MVRTADTEGAWSLIELTLRPGAKGASPHWHAKGSETLFVIEGMLDVALEGEERRLYSGEVMVIPPGHLHSFANGSYDDVRILMHSAHLDLEPYYHGLGRMLDETVTREDWEHYAKAYDVLYGPSAISLAAGSV